MKNVRSHNAVVARESQFERALIGAASAAVIAIVSIPAAEAGEPVEIDIPAQDLGAALNAFGRQTGTEIAFSPETVAGKRLAEAVRGEYEPDEALDKVLNGAGLVYRLSDANIIIVSDPNAKTAEAEERRGFFRVAQVDQKDDQEVATVSEREDAEGARDEIVVTGSQIRGVRSASPVQTFDREAIDMTGVSTLPQFFQTLPQNFNGGISESTSGVTGDNQADLNLNSGSGINLRGLGNDSTLILLNGRRLAPAGLGNFVDVSMVPLTAIERVEVLADGASAVYGSDAIGGVVNFILRDDYDGAETRLRYGTATSGDLDDIQLGQTFGAVWDEGHALISYEYQKRDPLDAADRNFAQDAREFQQLLPEQRRHSVFLTAGQNLNETIEVFGDAFYSIRDSKGIRTSAFDPANFDLSETEQYGGSVGSEIELAGDWQAGLVGSFSQSRTTQENKLLDGTEFAAPRTRESNNWSIDGKVDGTVFRLSGGDLKLAAGGHFRRETFTNNDSLKFDRDVFAFFGEMFAPLVGRENGIAGMERLELTAAARFEHYNDFGSSVDPKFGLLWSPVEGLDFRGTWGTSFRAPLFRELDESSVQGFLFDGVPNPASPTGSTLLALVLGGNAGLQPETAITWTAGFDFQPTSIPGLDLNATYFDINYKNRISSVIALFDVFTNPRFASLLDYDPDPAFLELLGSLPTSGNFAPGFSFTDAEVLADERESNQASTNVSGLDFSGSYSFDGDTGNWTLSLGGTYLFEDVEQLLASEDAVDVLDTVGRPVDLRLRGGVSWGFKDYSANLLVNYVDDYKDARAETVVGVDSWTTADLIISYDTGDRPGSVWLDNTVFSLSALNLFDQDPPFVASNFGSNINFDPNNASPIGRTIAFQIAKQW